MIIRVFFVRRSRIKTLISLQGAHLRQDLTRERQILLFEDVITGV